MGPCSAQCESCAHRDRGQRSGHPPFISFGQQQQPGRPANQMKGSRGWRSAVSATPGESRVFRVALLLQRQMDSAEEQRDKRWATLEWSFHGYSTTCTKTKKANMLKINVCKLLNTKQRAQGWESRRLAFISGVFGRLVFLPLGRRF